MNSLGTQDSKQTPPLKFAAGTHIGRKREENQDAFRIIEGASFHLFVVCDGMGGVKGGAVASNLAATVLDRELKELPTLTPEHIANAVLVANEEIFRKGTEDSSYLGMGTTLVGLGFTKDGLVVCNVGDSRAYRFRGGKIARLTSDHTLVQELVRAGSITSEQAEQHPVSHMLTRSLGPSLEVEVDCDLCPEDPEEGDCYLLCSDGLYNLVGEDEMLMVLSTNTLDQSIQELINLANERGGTDNITVLIATLARGSTVYGGPVIRNTGSSTLVAKTRSRSSSRLFPDFRKEAEVSTEPEQQVEEVQEDGKDKRLLSFAFIVGVLLAFIGGYAIRSWGGLGVTVNPSSVRLSSSRESNPIATTLISSELIRPAKPLLPELTTYGANDGEKQEIAQISKPFSETIALTDIDVSDISKRKQALEKSMEELDAKIEALSSPITGSIGDVLQRASNDWSETKNKLDKVRKDLDTATKNLASWYSRRKKLETTDAINLANETSSSSKEVLDQKKRFERDTWDYLKEAEALRLSPNDKALEARVQTLTKARAESMKLLSEIVKKTVEEEAVRADQTIVDLTTEKEHLEGKLEKSSREVEYAKALLSANPEAREAIRKELMHERDVAKAELNGLNALLPKR